MADNNRGRDLPRGAQFIRPDDKPKTVDEQKKIAKHRERVKKALAKIISDGGYYGLFQPNLSTPEKTITKRRTIVIEALALGLDGIPPLLLEHVGLKDEPNPPTNYVDDGKAPF